MAKEIFDAQDLACIGTPTEFTILAGQQQPGANVLTLISNNTAWLWGITDLLLEPATIV